MNPETMNPEIVKMLKSIVGENYVLETSVDGYLYDETPETVRPEPSRDVIVVRPSTAEEISEILRLANSEKIPVVVRGGGTGLSGGAIPVTSGIVISMDRLNRIIEIDTENLMAVCEAGVTLRELLEEVDKVPGLSFPPHPGHEGAHIGGLVVNNAGGARAVKYGIMRNYVVGLEIVLPDGEILQLGGKVVKNATGYDLLHLIVGSEGTLCVVTKVTLKLVPEPGATYTLVVPFESTEDAIKTVPDILRSGIIPLAIEYMDIGAIKAGERVTGKNWPYKGGEAHLMIIVDGKNEDELIESSEKIEGIAKEHNAMEVFVGMSRREQRDILDIRSLIYEGLKGDTIELLDVSVPIASIPEYVKRCQDAAERIGIEVLTYGHAGDGNIHQQILKSGLEEGVWRRRYEEFKEFAFDLSRELGGYITGEHGVGIVKKRDMYKTMPRRAVELMKAIKRAFDPNNILNPGKVVDI
jgi:glycolate oxidase